MADIKQIKVGGVNYDIVAKSLLDASGNAKSYEDILKLIELGFEVVKLTELPEADATAYATYHNDIVLIADSSSVTGACIEYVIIRSGEGTTASPYTYAWEKIGTTSTDLADYVKKGSYTTGAASGNTGSGGSQTATGSASVTYKKAATSTGSAGGVTVDFTKATFAGTEATISLTEGTGHTHTVSGSQAIAAHTHTLTPTTEDITYATGIDADETTTATVVTGVGANGTASAVTAAIKAASLDVKTATTEGYQEVITNSTPSLTGTTTFNTDAIKGVTLAGGTTNADGSIKYVEAVSHTAASLTGTKTFNTDAIKSVTINLGTTAIDGKGVLTDVSYTAPSISTTQFNTDAIKNVKLSDTATSGGISFVSAVTHTAATLTGTKTFATSGINASVADGILTLSTAGTGTVGISGGSISATTKHLTASGDAATKAAPTLTGGGISKTTKYLSATGTAASTGTVGISGGSISATTKYLTAAGVAASTGTVGISAGATKKWIKVVTTAADAKATVLTGVKATSTASVITNLVLTSATNTILTGASIGSGGAATVDFTKATIAAGKASVSGSFTPAGTISGSQTIAGHTHSITLTDTAATGTASVAVSAHTHSLNNHTHSITL